MDFRFFAPCARLRAFVRYYWVLKTGESIEALTFPIGCPQLIFHRMGRFTIPDAGGVQPRFTISGQVNFPAVMRSTGEIETIVAVFYPHSLATMFDIPVSAFYNREIDGYGLGDKSLSRLADRILSSDSVEEAITLLEQWLMERMSEAGALNYSRVGGAIRQIMNDRVVGTDALASEACLSRRQFERVFFNSVGMMPKEYTNIARFQKSLWLMQCGCRDFADITFACGYADQSHFIRECRRYAGLTPTALLRSQPVYSDLYASPI